jgi:CheY-like chemotaxis protein
MSPEVLARACEPFFTTKEIGKGTGLGLSMVYSTMRQMGGDIEIDSRPGEGTAVRLILPAAAQRPPDAAIAPEAAVAIGLPNAGRSTILYVEDDVLVSLATRDLLEEAGYVIHTAPDAMRALHVLDDHPDIDFLVTDIGLPGVDGHELAAQARRRRPDLKVLFLSGYDRSQLVGAPADPRTEHLGKPYAEASLFEALSRLQGAGPRGG